MSTFGNLLANLPADWIAIAAFAILVAFDSLRSGTSRAIALALAMPASILFFSLLQHAAVIGKFTAQFTSLSLQATLFGIVFAGTYILARRMAMRYSGNEGAVIQSVLAGAATAFVVVVLWLQVPALQSIWHLGAQVQNIFGEIYRFWWILGSYIALAAIRS